MDYVWLYQCLLTGPAIGYESLLMSEWCDRHPVIPVRTVSIMSCNIGGGQLALTVSMTIRVWSHNLIQ